MEKAIKVMLGLICVPLLILGFGTIFNPEAFFEKWGVIAQGANGLNTIRGIIGGMVGGTAAMIIIGLWKKNTAWLLAAATLMGIAVFGRFVGVVLDGFDPAIIGPTVAEALIIVFAIVLDKKSRQS